MSSSSARNISDNDVILDGVLSSLSPFGFGGLLTRLRLGGRALASFGLGIVL